jgi:hypothetical protein
MGSKADLERDKVGSEVIDVLETQEKPAMKKKEKG